MRHTLACLVFVTLAAVGCGSVTSPDGTPPDGGLDGAPDGGFDGAPPDAEPDAGPPELVVTVTPSSLSIETEETADFEVVISGGVDGALEDWTCTTADEALASVESIDNGCRVTGEDVGTTAITVAVSKGDQSTQQAVPVEVLPGPPRRRATLEISRSGVVVVGNLAYLRQQTSDGGLTVVDVSDPTAPQVIGDVTVLSAPTDMAVSGDFAYFSTQSSNGLQVVSVADPSNPQTVGELTGFTAQGVAVDASRAYVTAGTGGLRVVDISTPTAPSLIGSLSAIEGSFRRIALDGSHAYIAADGGGLRVISISNPAAPQEVADLALPGRALRLYVTDGIAYVGTGGEGTQALHVIDISTPASPTLLGSVTTPGSPTGIVTIGTRAYVTTVLEDAGLYVFDVSDPSNPSLLDTADTDTARGLDIVGRLAYVAGAPSRIVDLGVLGPQP